MGRWKKIEIYVSPQVYGAYVDVADALASGIVAEVVNVVGDSMVVSTVVVVVCVVVIVFVVGVVVYNVVVKLWKASS